MKYHLETIFTESYGLFEDEVNGLFSAISHREFENSNYRVIRVDYYKTALRPW